MLRTAIARWSPRVSNPADGEAHYRLGVLLVRTGRETEAEGYLAKASWNSAWRVPARFALARLKSRAGDFGRGQRRTARGARPRRRTPAGRRPARAACCAQLGHGAAEAEARLAATLAIDPLDQWARDLAGLPLTADAPTLLDVALEYAAAGFDGRAAGARAGRRGAPDNALGQVQVGPLVHYHRAMLLEAAGRPGAEARPHAPTAQPVDRALRQPSRAADVAALEARPPARPRTRSPPCCSATGTTTSAAMRRPWRSGTRAEAALLDSGRSGGRPPERDSLGDRAAQPRASPHTTCRATAPGPSATSRRARALAPDDAKLLFEYDQLAARLGATEASRLRRLEAHGALVGSRDDLSVVHAGLLITAPGAPPMPAAWLLARVFQPWEGGEGPGPCRMGCRQHRPRRGGARLRRRGGAPSPGSIRPSPARRPSGRRGTRWPTRPGSSCCAATPSPRWAVPTRPPSHGRHAASFRGDFQAMSVQDYSEQSCYSALALGNLGRTRRPARLGRRTRRPRRGARERPRPAIDYFATSLPTMLLFTDDPQLARERTISRIARPTCSARGRC